MFVEHCVETKPFDKEVFAADIVANTTVEE